MPNCLECLLRLQKNLWPQEAREDKYIFLTAAADVPEGSRSAPAVLTECVFGPRGSSPASLTERCIRLSRCCRGRICTKPRPKPPTQQTSKHSQAALETLPTMCRGKFQDRMQSKNSSLQHVPSMGHIPEHDSTLAAAQQPAQELGVNGVAVQRLAETKPAVESQATPKPKVGGGGWGMVRPGLKRTKSDASKQPDPEMGMKPEGSSAPAESTPLRRSLSNNGGWGALRRHSSSMDANEDSGGQPLALAHLLKYRLASSLCGCWDSQAGSLLHPRGLPGHASHKTKARSGQMLKRLFACLAITTSAQMYCSLPCGCMVMT